MNASVNNPTFFTGNRTKRRINVYTNIVFIMLLYVIISFWRYIYTSIYTHMDYEVMNCTEVPTYILQATQNKLSSKYNAPSNEKHILDTLCHKITQKLTLAGPSFSSFFFWSFSLNLQWYVPARQRSVRLPVVHSADGAVVNAERKMRRLVYCTFLIEEIKISLMNAY